MALGNLQHVEAVAIIRNLVAAVGPLRSDDNDQYADYCAQAAEQWLQENHPAPEVYIAALTEGAD